MMSSLDLETVLRVPYADTEFRFDISPDGERVAFSYNHSGAWEIWTQMIHEPDPPRQITRGPGAKFAPRWSPDGRALLYALDLDGSEAYDLYKLDLASGQAENLTPDTPELILPMANWSPDGSRVACVCERSGRFQAHILHLSVDHAAQMISTPYQDWEAHWSPDGSHLAVVTRAQGQDTELYLVSLDLLDPFPLQDGAGLLHARAPAWSPEGNRIAFASNRGGRFRVGIYAIENGDVDWLPHKELDQEYPHWSPDGRALVFLHGDGPGNELGIYDLDTGSISTASLNPGTYSQPVFSPGGDEIICLFENERHPPDLWSVDPRRYDFQQLTNSLPEDLDRGVFTAPEPVYYPGMEGGDVPGLLYQPAKGSSNGAAVVWVHGGPSWLSRRGWAPMIQHMVSRGWVVLAPNYRGSTGYGRGWQWANRFDLGGGDTRDVVAGADYLVELGLADPDRIAITGTSYGGYLTMTSLTGYPDRWAGGSAVVPFLNWFTEYEHEREDLRHWDRENMGVPKENPALFRERSPHFSLDRIQAPVQLIGGENDPRCPASESLEAAKVLETNGIEHELVVFQDQGHGALLTDRLVEAETRRIEFLAYCLRA